MPTRITADRLYGVTIRPQELVFYGAQVRCTLRTAPMTDAAVAITAQHSRLVVLEVEALIPADDALHAETSRLEVLKIGWELDLVTDPPCAAEFLVEDPAEVRFALERIAGCVNRLCSEAGHPGALTPELVDQLILDYRTKAVES